MSPPEVWGPAIWTLFHTLIEKLNSDAYPHVINSMFNMIVRICKFLPCPECSRDASNFLAKIKLSDYKTKQDFKNMLYLFHNYVNAKKRKRLFNYANIDKYANLNLIAVINNFIKHYNTKGNMNLIAESFQRSFVIKDFIKWIKYYSKAFTTTKINRIIKTNNNQNNIENKQHKEEKHVVEEKHVTEEKHVVEENPILEESTKINEIVIEESNNNKENINEKPKRKKKDKKK
jgi:hypothetical protein